MLPFSMRVGLFTKLCNLITSSNSLCLLVVVRLTAEVGRMSPAITTLGIELWMSKKSITSI